MRMVEKVARRLEPLAWAVLEIGDTTESKRRRSLSLRQARAAIEAMRDPDEEMIAAAEHVAGHSLYRYQAMIDKAVQESGE